MKIVLYATNARIEHSQIIRSIKKSTQNNAYLVGQTGFPAQGSHTPAVLLGQCASRSNRQHLIRTILFRIGKSCDLSAYAATNSQDPLKIEKLG